MVSKPTSPTMPPFKKLNTGIYNNSDQSFQNNTSTSSNMTKSEETITPAEQFAAFLEAKQEPLIEGSSCYLIPVRWSVNWEKWLKTLTENERNSPVKDLAIFDPIKFDVLLEVTGDGARVLSRGLMDGTDFNLVGQETFDKLSKWFGYEGQPIERKVILDSARYNPRPIVEIYPPEFLVAKSDDLHAPIMVTSSKAEKFKDLLERCCQILGIDKDISDVRMYSGLQSEEPSTYSLVHDNLANTVGTCSFCDNDCFVLECKNEDGTWPTIFSQESEATQTAGGYEFMKDDDIGWNMEPERKEVSISPLSNSPFGSAIPGSFPKYPLRSTSPKKITKPGVTGLGNLGNTCFMNSGLQCLSNTKPILEYFLSEKYLKELNRDNPLGMGGEVAVSYGNLIKEMWKGGNDYVSPRDFKSTISRFAPQFVGYQQHDSQELIAFLLDGLHEDLNRVKKKPYTEIPDYDGTIPDEEFAKNLWSIHKARNDSIIVDNFQGQYKSTLVCPECQNVSITFDPFMYLTLPLPIQVQVLFTFIFVPFDSKEKRKIMSLKMSSNATIKRAFQILKDKLTLSSKSKLVCYEIWSQKIFKVYEEDKCVKDFGSSDVIVVYEYRPIDPDALIHVQFNNNYKSFGSKNEFDIPFVICVKKMISVTELYNILLFYIQRYTTKNLDCFSFDETSSDQDFETLFEMKDLNVKDGLLEFNNDDKVFIEFNEKFKNELSKSENVLEPEKGIIESKDHFRDIDLNSCFNEFEKEEKLGQEDAWYCPKCKKHQEATKKLDLWKLPNILVVHLKRFSHSRYRRDKIENLIEFPIDDLDLTSMIQSNDVGAHYQLFAISNHFGGLGGGHYTAFAKNPVSGIWYDFDDSRATVISKTSLVTSAAYLLFYERKNTFNEEFSVQNGLKNEDSIEVQLDGPPELVDVDENSSLSMIEIDDNENAPV